MESNVRKRRATFITSVAVWKAKRGQGFLCGTETRENETLADGISTFFLGALCDCVMTSGVILETILLAISLFYSQRHFVWSCVLIADTLFAVMHVC